MRILHAPPRRTSRLTRTWVAGVIVVGLATGLGAPARAQDEGLIADGEGESELVPPEETPPPPTAHAPGAPPPAATRTPGQYAGVVPGRGPDAAQARRRKPPKPSVTWIGYQPREGAAARLFVETSVPVTHEQTTLGDVVTITIPGVRLASRNVGRRLDLSAFEGPIASVEVKQVRGRAGGVTLRVKLRAGGKQPAVMAEPAASGYHYLFMDFGI